MYRESEDKRVTGDAVWKTLSHPSIAESKDALNK